MAMPQSKALLPNSDNTRVTIVAYLAGDYVHHTKEEFNVTPGTRSLPMTLGRVPLGKSTLVIEAIAVASQNGVQADPGTVTIKSPTGYYAEKEITITGGVNYYNIDMDYGVIVKCEDSNYSKAFRGTGIDSINTYDSPTTNNTIGGLPLAADDFLILQQGKKPSEQKNFTSRLPNNLTAEDWLFMGYAVEKGSQTLWLSDDRARWNNNRPIVESSPEWKLYSLWEIKVPTATRINSDWVQISAGSFFMGSTSSNASDNEKPVHKVKLS